MQSRAPSSRGNSQILWTCVGVLLMSASAILGWMLDVPWMKGVWLGSRGMGPGTSLFLGFLAIMLCRLPVARRPANATRSVIWTVALMISFSAGLLVPLVHMLSWGLRTYGPESLASTWSAAVANPWIPSFQSAVCAFFLTVALVLVSIRNRTSQLVGQGIALTFGVSVTFMLFGYLLDATHWHATPFHPSMQLSPLTLLAIVLLSLGVFRRSKQVGAARLLTVNSAAGFAFRRLLSLALVPIISHWVFDGLAERGLLPAGLAFMFESIVTGTLMVWLLVWISQLLHKREQRMSVAQSEREQRLVNRERNRSTAAIDEVNERFLALFNASPVGLLLCDASGRICLWNPPVSHIFCYTDDELRNMMVEDLLPLELRSKHRELRETYHQDPKFRSMAANRELWGLTKLGTHVPVEVDLAPVQIDRQQYVLAAIVDITERVRSSKELKRYAEELEEANKALEGFTYAASHDLKAPMRAIDTLTKCLREELQGNLSPSSAEHLEKLQSRVSRMETLLDDLLTYSQQRDLQFGVEKVSVSELVDSVFAAVRPPDSFSLQYDSDVEHLNTARVPLELCLRNLIDNAIKHHDQRDGVVKVVLRGKEDRIEIRVIDDGPGIPAEFRIRVFQPFKTLKPKTQSQTSGIGLTLTRNIINRFGGIIRIEDRNESRGTIFVFDWPADMSVTPETARETSDAD